MEYAAVVLFALTAVAGLILAVKHFKGEAVSISSALPHGLLGAAGLVVYGMGAFKTGFTTLTAISLGCLVVAALGGFLLFFFHLQNKKLPKALIAVHALVAVSGFLMLLAFVFGGHSAVTPS